MKKSLFLLLAALVVIAGCQGPAADPDKYMRTHEPKTGGPDL